MIRTPLVLGNWKMNTSVEEGIALAQDITELTHGTNVEVGVLPPFTHLWPVRIILRDSHVGVGAQDIYWADKGAYTGEISGAMIGGWCRYVLAGHSERRHLFGETNEDVGRKVDAGLRHGLRVIIAVGETEAQRDGGETEAVVLAQLDAALAGDGAKNGDAVDIAYEPVWAIGTGRTATPAQAQEVCALIRERLRTHLHGAAERIRILYGGSVTPATAAEIFSEPDIDGGLIGGASLKPDDFAAIVAAARATASQPG